MKHRVRTFSWEGGILHALNFFFETFEEAMEHAKTYKCHGAKVYNHHGDLVFTMNYDMINRPPRQYDSYA